MRCLRYGFWIFAGRIAYNNISFFRLQQFLASVTGFCRMFFGLFGCLFLGVFRWQQHLFGLFSCFLWQQNLLLLLLSWAGLFCGEAVEILFPVLFCCAMCWGVLCCYLFAGPWLEKIGLTCRRFLVLLLCCSKGSLIYGPLFVVSVFSLAEKRATLIMKRKHSSQLYWINGRNSKL